LIKQVLFLILFSYILNAQEETSSALMKQKIEVKELKQELNNFYNEKEKEYQDRKKELDLILSQIQKEKDEIQRLHDKNLAILQDIQQTVQSKTSKIYNAMKPKIAADIFNEMINEGKIEDVFDIILKLKEKNVTLLLKFLSIPNAALITEKLENYNVEKDKKD
jgi:flagellar motility protein MotE (MotC chaperone)